MAAYQARVLIKRARIANSLLKMRSLGIAREKVDILNLFYDQLFPCSAMNRIQLVDSSLRGVYLLQRPISLAIEK